MSKLKKSEFDLNMQHLHGEISKKADDRQVSEDMLKLRFEIERLREKVDRMECNAAMSACVKVG